MASRDPATAAAIMRNAQAAERERLRCLARRQLAEEDGLLDEGTVQERADQLEREKLSAAGKKGARRRLARLAQARRIEAAYASLRVQAEFLVALLDSLAPVDPDSCDHSWPAELTAEATCETCWLPYPEWSEQVAA